MLSQPTIFQSEKVSEPRFSDEYDYLSKQLVLLCENWQKYLTHYVRSSESLFKTAEFPWAANERVLVSTLAASIVSANPKALIAEELPVQKLSSASANKGGRCDLWAHIPSASEQAFSFYLEAKKFLKTKQPEDVESLLNSNRGITRMLRDYAKARNGRLDQRSPYSNSKKRRHPHYVIGLICIPIEGSERHLNDISQAFQQSFSSIHKLEDSENGRATKRKIGRFPSVGLYTCFPGKRSSGKPLAMLATLTVLGQST